MFFKKKRIRYYVAYSHQSGFGGITIEQYNVPITYEVINAWRGAIARDSNLEGIVILDWKKIRKHEESRKG